VNRGAYAESGVYEIVNLVNAKRYIGSTVSFKKRWPVHLSYLKKGEHHNKKLQASFKKHGADAFVFRPLLFCAPKELLTYEQLCLDNLEPDYNLCPTAGNQLGVKQSAEWIENAHGWRRGTKMGPQSPEWIESRIKHCRGKKQAPEHVEKRVAQLRGKKMPPHSAEHRAKIAASCKTYHSFKKDRQCH
jgi:group I intron endonuclease